MQIDKKRNLLIRKLVIFAIPLLMCLSTITIINVKSVEPGPVPVVDGVISPGEYDDGLYIPLTGPWPPEAPFPPSLVDGYLYWDTQYLYIAVDEPFPNWGSGLRDNFVEFMWDASPSNPDLHAWVLWDDGDWSYVKCPKYGCWTVAADPYPGTSWWAQGTAVEFKFDYTLYGTSYGDSIQFIVDTSEDAHLYPPFGDCQVWPANPTYYPCETVSSVETWGTIVLDGNQPPIADANGPYSGLVGESIALDGTGSSDLDGTIVSYEWDLDNDGIYDDATGSTPSNSWSFDGTYPISLKVTDDEGLSDTDDTTVNIGEHAVDGIISPDEYDGGMAVELVDDIDPGVTYDAFIDWDSQYLYVAVDEPVPDYTEFAFDVGPLRDRWDLYYLFPSGVSGYQSCMKPDGAWATDTSPAAYEAFSDTATEFKFDYIAFGIALGDTIQMCIERGNPTAFWPEGGIIWQNPPRTPDPLTWGDVTLTPPTGTPPVADANGPYEAENCEYSITFDGSGSYDPDGSIVSYDWNFGDGTGWHNGIGATPMNSYTTFGEYTVKLRVTDNDGISDIDTTTAEIFGVEADAGGPYEDDNCDYIINFDGTGSTGYKPPLSYEWDFGDGSPHCTSPTPVKTYDAFGEYTVSVVITESGNGCWDKAKTTAKVYGVDADAGGPYNIIDSLDVQLVGSGSTGFEPPLSYSWDFDDSDGIQVDSTNTNPVHTYSSFGTYTVTLTVTESGNGCSDTATSTVNCYKDPPSIELLYPIGGETLSDTVTIEWEAYDNQDGDDLPIYLYYSDDEENWYQINDVIENTGEYEWDTTTIPDGTYKLLAEAIDSANSIGHDMNDPFEIDNDEPPDNNPPNQPSKPSGPTYGYSGDEYTYSSSTTDPENDQIYYLFDWDDGTDSGWLGPFDSGDPCHAPHIYSSRGTFSIKVKAKDTNGSESVSPPIGYNNSILGGSL